ncbi:hypothetical protein RvY_02187 [Ramazzottius varieornatus]|uniref:Uncharacterized protein n=1 Tax=Ramazzottius varieornatus TaxID=947166 RepID=A0A1D1UM88_RAMVA|nr:hypothetical protein RvY_02187 [Ramazzottius varieornatus]
MARVVLNLLLLFALLDVCLCQFFVNGRYGKRSQESSGSSELEGMGNEMASSSTHDASLPRMYCFYTGYQSLYNCRRLGTDDVSTSNRFPS